MEDLSQPLLAKPSCNDHRAIADHEKLILRARSWFFFCSLSLN